MPRNAVPRAGPPIACFIHSMLVRALKDRRPIILDPEHPTVRQHAEDATYSPSPLADTRLIFGADHTHALFCVSRHRSPNVRAVDHDAESHTAYRGSFIESAANRFRRRTVGDDSLVDVQEPWATPVQCANGLLRKHIFQLSAGGYGRRGCRTHLAGAQILAFDEGDRPVGLARSHPGRRCAGDTRSPYATQYCASPCAESFDWLRGDFAGVRGRFSAA